MIEIEVDNQKVDIDSWKTLQLVSGTQQMYTVHYTFSDEWEGLAKTAVFSFNNTKPKEIVLDSSNTCQIPYECLKKIGNITFGVYGVDGTKRYPTVWSLPVMIIRGVEQGESSSDPTESVYEQIITQLNSKASTDSVVNLAAAVESLSTLKVNVSDIADTSSVKEYLDI